MEIAIFDSYTPGWPPTHHGDKGDLELLTFHSGVPSRLDLNYTMRKLHYLLMLNNLADSGPSYSFPPCDQNTQQK